MRALARALTHPALCITCGVLLFFDWCSLANTMTRRSTAAQYCPLNPRRLGTVYIPRLPVKLARTRAGLRATLLGNGPLLIPDDWEPVHEFALARLPARQSGFWAMTARTEGITFYGDESLTPAERDQLFPALIAAFESATDGPALDPLAHSLLKAGVMSRTETLPAGYFHNAMAVMVGLLLLAGLPRTAVAIIQLSFERREQKRRARGLCPACAYDLRGEFNSGCPECGWNHSRP